MSFAALARMPNLFPISESVRDPPSEMTLSSLISSFSFLGHWGTSWDFFFWVCFRKFVKMRFPEFEIPEIEYNQDCQIFRLQKSQIMGQTGLENDNFFYGIFLVRTFLKMPKLTPNHFLGGQEVSKNAKLAILNTRSMFYKRHPKKLVETPYKRHSLHFIHFKRHPLGELSYVRDTRLDLS